MSHPEINTSSRQDALAFFDAEGLYYFAQNTSRAGSRLATLLRGGKKAEPSNIGPAVRVADELERRFEAIVVKYSVPPAPEPTEARAVPSSDNLPALLSSAGSDARYIKNLTYGGGGMPTGKNIAEALRVVRELRPKLEAAWVLYDALPKPERIPMTNAAQEAFWRKLDVAARETRALG